jgi:phage baseplate assembly protein W
VTDTSVAVRIPFAIDSTGSVSTTADLSLQQLDRVQALVATLPGERVMRSTYGVASSGLLFAPQELAATQAQLLVKDAVATWEPSAVLAGVDASINTALGLVDIRVQVARSDTPGAESASSRAVTVSAGGTVSQV